MLTAAILAVLSFVPVQINFNLAHPVLIEVAQAAEVPAPAPEPEATTTPDIFALIHAYAVKNGVRERSMIETMRCETAGTFNPDIQSGAHYIVDHPEWHVKAGDRELSYGLAQIHIPDNDVTIAQAKDPEFAIRFMAEHFAHDQASMWTCWRNLRAAGKI